MISVSQLLMSILNSSQAATVAESILFSSSLKAMTDFTEGLHKLGHPYEQLLDEGVIPLDEDGNQKEFTIYKLLNSNCLQTLKGKMFTGYSYTILLNHICSVNDTHIGFIEKYLHVINFNVILNLNCLDDAKKELHLYFIRLATWSTNTCKRQCADQTGRRTTNLVTISSLVLNCSDCHMCEPCFFIPDLSRVPEI